MDDERPVWLIPMALYAALVTVVLGLTAQLIDSWYDVGGVALLFMAPSVGWVFFGPQMVGRVLQWWDARAERKELAE